MENTLEFIDVLHNSRRRRSKYDLGSYEYSFEAEIANIYPMTSSEKLYQIQIVNPEKRRHFSFHPGQFVMLEVPGIGEAPFSICSSPVRHGDLELCIRKAGTLTSFLDRVQRGTRVGISGPFGSYFPVEKMLGQNILLIGGGLGIVPLRAPILTVLEHRNQYRKVDIIYGARHPAELLFSYEYPMWRKFDINLQIIVDQPDEQWQGPTGLITAILDQRIASASKAFPGITHAIVCGPPAMFTFVCQRLIAVGIPMQKIFVSLERRMHCGRGKCCRCNIGSTYTCLEGPVFDYWTVMNLKEAI